MPNSSPSSFIVISPAAYISRIFNACSVFILALGASSPRFMRSRWVLAPFLSPGAPSSFEKMVTITAGWIITTVKCIQRVRVLPSLEEESYSLRPIISFASPKETIPFRITASHPWPTLIWPSYIHFGPEAFNVLIREGRQWLRFICNHQSILAPEVSQCQIS